MAELASIIAKCVSTRHLIQQYGLILCIYVCMSVTLWNAIINAWLFNQRPLPTPRGKLSLEHPFVLRVELQGCLNDLDNWPGSINGDRGAAQVLIVGEKKQDELQELGRQDKGGKYSCMPLLKFFTGLVAHIRDLKPPFHLRLQTMRETVARAKNAQQRLVDATKLSSMTLTFHCIKTYIFRSTRLEWMRDGAASRRQAENFQRRSVWQLL